MKKRSLLLCALWATFALCQVSSAAMMDDGVSCKYQDKILEASFEGKTNTLHFTGIEQGRLLGAAQGVSYTLVNKEQALKDSSTMALLAKYNIHQGNLGSVAFFVLTQDGTSTLSLMKLYGTDNRSLKIFLATSWTILPCE